MDFDLDSLPELESGAAQPLAAAAQVGHPAVVAVAAADGIAAAALGWGVVGAGGRRGDFLREAACGFLEVGGGLAEVGGGGLMVAEVSGGVSD